MDDRKKIEKEFIEFLDSHIRLTSYGCEIVRALAPRMWHLLRCVAAHHALDLGECEELFNQIGMLLSYIPETCVVDDTPPHLLEVIMKAKRYSWGKIK